jgi:uncharacterized protein (DUF1684 family)
LDSTQRETFNGLAYYDYDPNWRIKGRVDTDVPSETFQVDLGADGRFRYSRVACIRFSTHNLEASLSLFWVEGYGGGLFLPFRDPTNAHSTFGGGRYLYDTIKGADLGFCLHEIWLDFNYAYNPSCAYNSYWVCPLSPLGNKLPFPVNAGEMVFS